MKFTAELPQGSDVIAGISVAAVLLPQAMAYAELAGLPPQVGLFAAAIAPLAAAPFVSSPYLQTGPVALTGLLTFGALEGRADAFTADYVELAVLLALLVGLFRLLLGALQLGNLAFLLSGPVLIGFTSGAAILIVASQLPGALGAPTSDQGVLKGALDALSTPGVWQIAALAFALATAAIMLGGQRIHRFFPGVLVAVVASIIISQATSYDGAVIGTIPGGFVHLHTAFPWASTPSLLPAAAAIALVGFAEPSSIARQFANEERQTWDANREMVGQGVANVASAFAGGLPDGGSFSRSALSRAAGGKSRWSGAVAGFIILLLLPFAPLAEPLPRAVLAAIVITSVVKLVKLPTIVRMLSESAPQAIVSVGTLTATLAFAPRVERGVFVGIVLAIGVHLYRELNVVADEHVDGSTLTIAPQGVLWFATVPRIERICRTVLATDPDVNHIVFDLAGVGRLDYTGAATLQQSIATFTAAGVTVDVINIQPGAQRAARIHIETATSPQPE